MKSRKGGVPVPYIVAIVLGIAVIGLIGYWLFYSSGKLGGSLAGAECSAKQVEWCSRGYDKDQSQDWATFAKVCVDNKISLNPPTNCDEILSRKKDCSTLSTTECTSVAGCRINTGTGKCEG